jgi:hypothetical protein
MPIHRRNGTRDDDRENRTNGDRNGDMKGWSEKYEYMDSIRDLSEKPRSGPATSAPPAASPMGSMKSPSEAKTAPSNQGEVTRP